MRTLELELGSKHARSGRATFSNTKHRVASAMAAYGPMSSKVFGSSKGAERYKIHFNDSLIMSRLLHSVHVTVPSAKDMKKFNGVYMRVLRKITDDFRYSAVVKMSDREVRESLRLPSLDCILIKMSTQSKPPTNLMV